ncbi:MAG: aspartate aminotransferase family protein [Firmicutes bacterium]|nr:aspartate aminotransferase family protein [Bacillota bacterium]MBR3393790.1 aspartate aminotransferase family protein [Bacillota bacterium]
MNIQQIDQTYVASTYGRMPVALVKGKGALAWDENGKEYIDLGAGIAVNSFGYSDDAWVQAVTEQLGKISHTSNLYYTSPDALLAKMLCEKTGMKKVFFGNSGAEANECAIKTARKWAYDQYGDESHSTIITLKNSFHGRTIATLAATGQDKFHTHFGPFPGGFVYATPEDPEELEKLASENNCCAIMIELVQGEGGVVPLSKAYVEAVVKTAEKHGLLIIDDEVQTGNGRTGTLYTYMQYGFMPDIVSTAKGLGGGLPIGACLLGEKVKNTLTPGSHGSTFGGNPVSCAGALSILSRIDEDLLASVRAKSDYIFQALTGAKGVQSVTGLGLMIGIACDKPVGEILSGCLANGVIVLSAHDKVRLLPPLSISMEQLSKAVDVLKKVIAE